MNIVYLFLGAVLGWISFSSGVLLYQWLNNFSFSNSGHSKIVSASEVGRIREEIERQKAKQ